MAISVVMPALEIAQETGTLVAWRKKEGEKVARGESASAIVAARQQLGPAIETTNGVKLNQITPTC